MKHCTDLSPFSVSFEPAVISLNVRIMKILFMMKCFIIISLFSIAIQENLAQYVPPTPSVEPLYPIGLRMSIANEDGISLVAYHVKFNDDFYSLEAGTIARDIIKPRNGRWVYEDRSTKLKLGDIIYYWVHVVYNGLGYNLLGQKHVVNEFYNYDASPLKGNNGNTPEKEIDTCTASSQTKIFENNSKNQLLNRQICPGQLIFEENFDSLNTTRWTILERFAGPPSYEFVVYMNNIENVKVKDGVLHIEPILTNEKYGADFIRSNSLTLEKCTGIVESQECKRVAIGSHIIPPVISGRLNTKSSFNFQYGRIQIRAKLPRGDWLFPLITLESTDMCTKNSSIYCDIVIVHSNGNSVLISQDGNDLSGHFLLGGAHAIDINSNVPQDNKLNLPKKKSETLWSDGYHVYDLEWKPNQIIVKVDGVEYGQQNVPALYDIPVYINIGLAVGGHTIFPDNCISGNYVKPWRNVGSKVISIFLVLLFNTNKNISDALNIYLFIHDFLQYNIAGTPLFHEKTQWDFDPEIGKQRRVRYEQENGHHGEFAIAKLGMGIGYKEPWAEPAQKLIKNS